MKNKNNLMIWKSVRISFYLLCLFLIISSFIVDYIDSIGYMIFAFLLIIDIFWCFITSIIHLTKYKEKGFAITSLVISSILVLIFLIFIGTSDYSYDTDLNYSIELECESICSEFDSDNYKLVKEKNYEKFSCDCYNDKELIVSYWLYDYGVGYG